MSSKSLPNLSISVQQSSWEGNTDGGEQGSTNEALSHLRTAGEEELFRGNLPAFVNTDLKLDILSYPLNNQDSGDTNLGIESEQNPFHLPIKYTLQKIV